jgi:hypothetical protein
LGYYVSGCVSEKFSNSTPSCQGPVQTILSLAERTRYPSIQSEIKGAKNQTPERRRKERMRKTKSNRKRRTIRNRQRRTKKGREWK